MRASRRDLLPRTGRRGRRQPHPGQLSLRFARRLAAGGGSAHWIGEYIQNSVFQPLVDDFGREHARRIAVAIVGFLFGRYVLALPMFTALTRDDAGRLLLSMIR